MDDYRKQRRGYGETLSGPDVTVRTRSDIFQDIPTSESAASSPGQRYQSTHHQTAAGPHRSRSPDSWPSSSGSSIVEYANTFAQGEADKFSDDGQRVPDPITSSDKDDEQRFSSNYPSDDGSISDEGSTNEEYNNVSRSAKDKADIPSVTRQEVLGAVTSSDKNNEESSTPSSPSDDESTSDEDEVDGHSNSEQNDLDAVTSSDGDDEESSTSSFPSDDESTPDEDINDSGKESGSDCEPENNDSSKTVAFYHTDSTVAAAPIERPGPRIISAIGPHAFGHALSPGEELYYYENGNQKLYGRCQTSSNGPCSILIGLGDRIETDTDESDEPQYKPSSLPKLKGIKQIGGLIMSKVSSEKAKEVHFSADLSASTTTDSGETDSESDDEMDLEYLGVPIIIPAVPRPLPPTPTGINMKRIKELVTVNMLHKQKDDKIKALPQMKKVQEDKIRALCKPPVKKINVKLPTKNLFGFPLPWDEWEFIYGEFDYNAEYSPERYKIKRDDFYQRMHPDIPIEGSLFLKPFSRWMRPTHEEMGFVLCAIPKAQMFNLMSDNPNELFQHIGYPRGMVKIPQLRIDLRVRRSDRGIVTATAYMLQDCKRTLRGWYLKNEDGDSVDICTMHAAFCNTQYRRLPDDIRDLRHQRNFLPPIVREKFAKVLGKPIPPLPEYLKEKKMLVECLVPAYMIASEKTRNAYQWLIKHQRYQLDQLIKGDFSYDDKLTKLSRINAETRCYLPTYDSFNRTQEDLEAMIHPIFDKLAPEFKLDRDWIIESYPVRKSLLYKRPTVYQGDEFSFNDIFERSAKIKEAYVKKAMKTAKFPKGYKMACLGTANDYNIPEINPIPEQFRERMRKALEPKVEEKSIAEKENKETSGKKVSIALPKEELPPEAHYSSGARERRRLAAARNDDAKRIQEESCDAQQSKPNAEPSHLDAKAEGRTKTPDDLGSPPETIAGIRAALHARRKLKQSRQSPQSETSQAKPEISDNDKKETCDDTEHVWKREISRKLLESQLEVTNSVDELLQAQRSLEADSELEAETENFEIKFTKADEKASDEFHFETGQPRNPPHNPADSACNSSSKDDKMEHLKGITEQEVSVQQDNEKPPSTSENKLAAKQKSTEEPAKDQIKDDCPQLLSDHKSEPITDLAASDIAEGIIMNEPASAATAPQLTAATIEVCSETEASASTQNTVNKAPVSLFGSQPMANAGKYKKVFGGYFADTEISSPKSDIAPQSLLRETKQKEASSLPLLQGTESTVLDKNEHKEQTMDDDVSSPSPVSCANDHSDSKDVKDKTTSDSVVLTHSGGEVSQQSREMVLDDLKTDFINEQASSVPWLQATTDESSSYTDHNISRMYEHQLKSANGPDSADTSYAKLGQASAQSDLSLGDLKIEQHKPSLKPSWLQDEGKKAPNTEKLGEESLARINFTASQEYQVEDKEPQDIAAVPAWFQALKKEDEAMEYVKEKETFSSTMEDKADITLKESSSINKVDVKKSKDPFMLWGKNTKVEKENTLTKSSPPPGPDDDFFKFMAEQSKCDSDSSSDISDDEEIGYVPSFLQTSDIMDKDASPIRPTRSLRSNFSDANTKVKQAKSSQREITSSQELFQEGDIESARTAIESHSPMKSSDRPKDTALDSFSKMEAIKNEGELQPHQGNLGAGNTSDIQQKHSLDDHNVQSPPAPKPSEPKSEKRPASLFTDVQLGEIYGGLMSNELLPTPDVKRKVPQAIKPKQKKEKQSQKRSEHTSNLDERRQSDIASTHEEMMTDGAYIDHPSKVLAPGFRRSPPHLNNMLSARPSNQISLLAQQEVDQTRLGSSEKAPDKHHTPDEYQQEVDMNKVAEKLKAIQDSQKVAGISQMSDIEDSTLDPKHGYLHQPESIILNLEKQTTDNLKAENVSSNSPNQSDSDLWKKLPNPNSRESSLFTPLLDVSPGKQASPPSKQGETPTKPDFDETENLHEKAKAKEDGIIIVENSQCPQESSLAPGCQMTAEVAQAKTLKVAEDQVTAFKKYVSPMQASSSTMDASAQIIEGVAQPSSSPCTAKVTKVTVIQGDQMTGREINNVRPGSRDSLMHPINAGYEEMLSFSSDSELNFDSFEARTRRKREKILKKKEVSEQEVEHISEISSIRDSVSQQGKKGHSNTGSAPKVQSLVQLETEETVSVSKISESVSNGYKTPSPAPASSVKSASEEDITPSKAAKVKQSDTEEHKKGNGGSGGGFQGFRRPSPGKKSPVSDADEVEEEIQEEIEEEIEEVIEDDTDYEADSFPTYSATEDDVSEIDEDSIQENLEFEADCDTSSEKELFFGDL